MIKAKPDEPHKIPLRLDTELPKNVKNIQKLHFIASPIDQAEKIDETINDSKEINNVLPSGNADTEKPSKNKIAASQSAVHRHVSPTSTVNLTSAVRTHHNLSEPRDIVPKELINKKIADSELERNMLPKFNLTFLNESGVKKFAPNVSKGLGSSVNVDKKNANRPGLVLNGSENKTANAERRIKRQVSASNLSETDEKAEFHDSEFPQGIIFA